MSKRRGILRVVTGFVTQSNTGAAWTLATGDSLTLLNSPGAIALLAAWGDWQTAGFLTIKSPRLADGVNGIKLEGVASEVYPLLEYPNHEYFVAQDVLTVTQSGSNTAGDIESGSLLFYYPEEVGNFITYDEFLQYRVRNQTIENTLALGTAGGYSGEEAINAEMATFSANTWYALAGYNTTVECCTLGWRGPDTGWYRVAGPGHENNKDLTRDWFVKLAQKTGLRCIPVFNSANASSTLIDGVQDENGADPTVTQFFTEMRPSLTNLLAA